MSKSNPSTALVRDALGFLSSSLEQVNRHYVAAAVTCGFLLSWKLSGALLVPLVLLLFWKVAAEYLWGQQRRKQLAAAGLPNPGTVALYRQHKLAKRRIRLVRRQFPAACEGLGLKSGKGKEVRTPALSKVTTTVDLDVTAKVSSNRTNVLPEDIKKHSERIRRTIECKELLVTYTKDTTNCDIAFRWTFALGRVLHLKDMPKGAPKRIVYGIKQDGTAAMIRYDLSLLIGGLTRHGKSNCVWALLADLLRQGIPVRLYISDPKGGIELHQFADSVPGEKMGTLEVRQYTNTVDGTIAMVESAFGALEKRKREQVGKNWTIDERNPLTIIILDELLPLHEMIKEGEKGSLGKILYTGAASGFVVWANAQIGHADVLGTLRNFIPQRICFATPTSQTTDTFLGTGAELRGAKCSEIDEPGLCYATFEDSREPQLARAALVTEDDMAVVAKGGIPAGMDDASTGLPDEQVAVYPLTGFEGELLYVGISDKPGRRFREHIANPDKPWCQEKDHPDNQVDWEATQRGIRWYANEGIARKVEERLIKDKLPQHNVVHAKRKPWHRGHVEEETEPTPRGMDQGSIEELEAMLAQPAVEPQLDLDEQPEPVGYVTDTDVPVEPTPPPVETPEAPVPPAETEALPQTPEPPRPPDAPATSKATRPTRSTRTRKSTTPRPMTAREDYRARQRAARQGS